MSRQLFITHILQACIIYEHCLLKIDTYTEKKKKSRDISQSLIRHNMVIFTQKIYLFEKG